MAYGQESNENAVTLVPAQNSGPSKKHLQKRALGRQGNLHKKEDEGKHSSQLRRPEQGVVNADFVPECLCLIIKRYT